MGMVRVCMFVTSQVKASRNMRHVYFLLDKWIRPYLKTLMQHHGALPPGSMGETSYIAPAGQYSLQETAVADASYEVLSVLHLMAMVCLLQANTLLLPRSYGDRYTPRVSEESRRATVDVFLKAAEYID
ncbi:unnamed protein product [Urochloa humidicola]